MFTGAFDPAAGDYALHRGESRPYLERGGAKGVWR